MRRIISPRIGLGVATALMLGSLPAVPVAAQTFDRGQVERFATLPEGEAHPEGITVDSEGNVIVATVAFHKPDDSPGTLITFDRTGKHVRTVRVAGSRKMLLDIRFHPLVGNYLVVDYLAAKILAVDPRTGDSSVFMTVDGKDPGLDYMAIDAAGNVFTTDAHQGIIWLVGKEGGKGVAWVRSDLLKPKRTPPPIGANGIAINRAGTALFVANTSDDTIVKIPLSGSPPVAGKPEVFAHRIGGGPDGILVDEEDNLWVACNQADEIVVIEPTEGRVIAKLGDFGGIDRDGAPIGLLWSNTMAFSGEDLLVTNLSLDSRIIRPDLKTSNSPWAAEVKRHTVAKLKRKLPSAPE